MAAVGVNLQRLGKHRSSAGLTAFGIFLATSCGLADLASFQFAPQSLLAPFASLGLVVNLFCAPMHGEKISLFDCLCTVMVVAGVAVCLSSASTEQPTRTPDELAMLATREPFVIWGCVEVAVLALAVMRAMSGAAMTIATAAANAVRAGIFGGMTVLSAKLLTECVAADAPFTWVVCLGAFTGLVAVSQVVCLNAAVGKYSSLLIVPLFTATSLATNASGGGLFFDEFSAFTAEQARSYAAGGTLLMTGVGLIASKAGGQLAAPEDDKAKAA